MRDGALQHEEVIMVGLKGERMTKEQQGKLESVICDLRKEEYRRHGVHGIARVGSYGVCGCILAQSILDLEELLEGAKAPVYTEADAQKAFLDYKLRTGGRNVCPPTHDSGIR